MMEDRKFKIPLKFKDHELSVRTLFPEDPKALIVFAHGAGAGMEHSFMNSISEDLLKRNIATLRFNFLYMDTGRKSPDRPNVSMEVIREIIDFASKNYSTPLFLGGKSYGGRMSSMVMAENTPKTIRGLIFWGYPLHAPGRPSIDRAAHLSAIPVPTLFLQGTRDKLAELELITNVCEPLELASLKIIEGADHGFHVLKRSGRTDNEVVNELGDEVESFVNKNI